VKATQGVGTPRLDSGRKFPVPSINLHPTIPISEFGIWNLEFKILLLFR
jgi:hypothetical protein